MEDLGIHTIGGGRLSFKRTTTLTLIVVCWSVAVRFFLPLGACRVVARQHFTNLALLFRRELEPAQVAS